MNVPPEVLIELADLSLTKKQLSGVLKVIARMQQADDARRESQRQRKARSRDRRVTVTGQSQGQTRDSHSDQVPPKEIPHTPLETTPSTSLRSDNKHTARASRIPDDFQPDLAEASRLGLSPADATIEAANFIDYWHQANGRTAVKRDWPAAWRVWSRKAVSQQENRNGQRAFEGNGNGRSRDPKAPLLRALADIAAEGLGHGGRSADPDEGVPDPGRPEPDDRAPSLDLGPADFRRAG